MPPKKEPKADAETKGKKGKDDQPTYNAPDPE